jgi:hypothetical protein
MELIDAALWRHCGDAEVEDAEVFVLQELEWSGVRESDPRPRLGKPLYYHCTNPASGSRQSPYFTQSFGFL